MSDKLKSFLINAPKPSMKILIFDVYNLVFKYLFASYYEYKQHKTQYQLGIETEKYTEEMMYDYWLHLFVSGFFSNIKRVKPDRVIMAIEGGGKCWRKTLYPNYKANRKHDDMEIDFQAFKNKMIAFLKVMEKTFTNVYFISEIDTEADDVMAVLTKEFSKDLNNEIEIISTDSDLYQLQINKNVRQYNTNKKEYSISINPLLDLEIKVLSGDKSDNITAIFNRCGPKTAQKVINEGLEKYLEKEEVREIYERNLKLIDFKYIPHNFQENILNKFDNYKIQKLEPMNVYNFFIKNGLVKLSDDWQMNYPYIKELS